MIKIEFDCDKDKFDLVCEKLLDISGGKNNVIIYPRRSFNNYCGFYKGSQGFTEKFDEILSKLYEKGVVCYYSVSHINL